MQKIDKHITDDEGATMVEYGFLLAGIAIVVYAAAVILGADATAPYDAAAALFG